MAIPRIHVDAAPEAVWLVVGDAWAEIATIVPAITESKLVTDGPLGAGSTRACKLAEPIMGMAGLVETLTSWEPEHHRFSYVFAQAPWPVKEIHNHWALHARDDGTTDIEITPRVVMRGGAMGRLFAPLMLWTMARGLVADFPEMRRLIEARATRG